MSFSNGVLPEHVLISCVPDWTWVAELCTVWTWAIEIRQILPQLIVIQYPISTAYSSLHPIFATHILTVPHFYSICPPCTPHIQQLISIKYPLFITHFQSVCTHFIDFARTVPHCYSTSQDSIPFIISSEHIFDLYSTQADNTGHVQNEAHLYTYSKSSLHPMSSVYPIFTAHVMTASHHCVPCQQQML